MSYQADRTLVTVEDRVPARSARPLSRRLLADAGGGHGLTAMRERAAAGRRQRPGRADRRRVASRAGGAGVTDAPGRQIRVLIADDQRVVREGLSMLVGLIDGVEVVGTACDGAEAVRLAEVHRPDVILMDLRMPGTDGIAATADLRERLPAARVLVLTTYADEDAIVPALQAGARGYLTKDASAEQIETAIRAVHAGQTHLDPAVQERLVAAVISQPAARGAARPGLGAETARRAHRPRGRGAHPARLGPEQRRDRPAPLPRATPRSRPTSTGSSPRPVPATAPRPSGTPTSTAWRLPRNDTMPWPMAGIPGPWHDECRSGLVLAWRMSCGSM